MPGFALTKIHASTHEDKLRLLESCVRGIVMEFDEETRYLEVWTHDEALLARPRAELIGATIIEVLGVERGRPITQMIAKARAKNEPTRMEYPLMVLGGPRWFAAEAFPGRRAGTVVVLVQDITARKQLEARLMESDRLAAIGLLAGGVGHEINTPLAWVMTQLFTLNAALTARAREGADDFARWAALASDALEGTERIRQVVRDLNFFTRSPERESKTIDLRRALEWAADMSMAEVRHRARLVKVYGHAPMVSAPEAQLGQVFLNLLINAAQSIDEGHAEANEVRIELSTDPQGCARVEVIDTGNGIAPENLTSLFEPFFTTKPRGVGTGLGLTVSRRIIEAVGGSLELVSSRNKHTRFRVTLPAATLPVEPPARQPPPVRRAGAHLRVLLIDDQPRFLASLKHVLEEFFDVETDSSPRVALARLKNGERFDAVVCDLMMPDMTGMDFHQALSVELPAMVDRLVFMTGGAFSARAQDFLLAVPNARIEKPFRPEELEAVVLRVCGPAAPA